MKVLLDNGMHHLDIKPDNMLLSSSCEALLTDYGNVTFNEKTSKGGAVMFLCPELYRSHKKSPCEKVDVWALGISLYAMLSGNYPYTQMDDSAVKWVEQLQKGEDPFLSKSSDNIKDLLTKMLCVDPDKRIGIDEILRHPWLQEGPKRNGKSDSSSSNTSSCSLSSMSSGCGLSKGFVIAKAHPSYFSRVLVDALLRDLKGKSSQSQLSFTESDKLSPRQKSGFSSNSSPVKEGKSPSKSEKESKDKTHHHHKKSGKHHKKHSKHNKPHKKSHDPDEHAPHEQLVPPEAKNSSADSPGGPDKPQKDPAAKQGKGSGNSTRACCTIL